MRKTVMIAVIFTIASAVLLNSQPRVLEGKLTLRQRPSSITGMFKSASRTVSFRSQEKSGTKLISVQVNTKSLILKADIDFEKQIASLSGKEARMSSDDRLLLLSALRAIESYKRISDESNRPVAQALLGSLGLWSEWPDSVSLEQRVSDSKSIKTLCEEAKCKTATGLSYFGSCTDSDGKDTTHFYEYAKHDCDHGDSTNPVNQQAASMGDHARCDGDELYWDGSTWQCGELDHKERPKVKGNCFGRCGPDCGTRGVYTEDCLNHDGCVRNGHTIASPYCDGEFISCIDDELFGSDCYKTSP